ncbi:hypothetical protein F4604DRAFT_1674060 [Suillus subluteus]|nr:hypothetical protein F4604DRAFT_1674060 [Suillus subluteus]
MIFDDVAVVVIHEAITQGSGPSTNTALCGQSIDRYENEVCILDTLIDISAEEEAMFESLASDILQSRRHQNPASGMINEVDSNVPAVACALQIHGSNSRAPHAHICNSFSLCIYYSRINPLCVYIYQQPSFSNWLLFPLWS